MESITPFPARENACFFLMSIWFGISLFGFSDIIKPPKFIRSAELELSENTPEYHTLGLQNYYSIGRWKVDIFLILA